MEETPKLRSSDAAGRGSPPAASHLAVAREWAHGVTSGVRDPDTCVTSCCCCKDVCMSVPCGLKDTLKASDWPGCPHCCRAWCRRWSQRAQRRERQLPCSCRRRCRARAPDPRLEPCLFHLGRACALPFRGRACSAGQDNSPVCGSRVTVTWGRRCRETRADARSSEQISSVPPRKRGDPWKTQSASSWRPKSPAKNAAGARVQRADHNMLTRGAEALG